MTVLQIRLALAVNDKQLRRAMADSKSSEVAMLLGQRAVLKDRLIEMLIRDAA
jgi:hypothetical protein